ncbi:hypothetical protein [Spiroplasma culicicola]|uniref:Uncharacterized protein n=1 Tax=Spiroplasma culicicola AES-1 TaxID=1276246 RepID=W6A8B4_9MOLU|nr:hypothetical protein [Spiroplasma culicicola]AHI53232.1 hypothetical protein SCULI_v1c08920 [Spiroplasma culicicola AES-1]
MSQSKENQNLLSDLAKKRLDEIKRSEELMGNSAASQQYFIPKRKDNQEVEIVKKTDESIIKPRKHKNLPFSSEEKTEIQKTFSEVKSDLKEKEKANSKLEKQLIKEGYKISKMVKKTTKKINQMIEKDVDQEDIEKTIELKDNYVDQLKEIHENIKVVNSNYDINMTLKDRRKQIYSNAYNAETERARKLMAMREKGYDGGFNWQNHVEDSEFVQPDKNAGLQERKKTRSWEERIKDHEDDQ